MQVRRGDAFQDVNGFQIQTRNPRIRPQRKRTVARRAAEKQIKRGGHQRMIPGEKLNFLTGQGALTITGDSEPIRRQTGEGIRKYSC